MIRYPVLSSRISNVGWENNTMEIQFKDGAIYQYLNVSKEQYLDFLAEPSLGKALFKFDKIHKYIKIA